MFMKVDPKPQPLAAHYRSRRNTSLASRAPLARGYSGVSTPPPRLLSSSKAAPATSTSSPATFLLLLLEYIVPRHRTLPPASLNQFIVLSLPRHTLDISPSSACISGQLILPLYCCPAPLPSSTYPIVVVVLLLFCVSASRTSSRISSYPRSAKK